MLATLKVKEEKANHIPAVVHIDKTSRLKIVSKEFNPLYYELIKNYHQISEIPVVLNTSFNIKGEPIVCTLEDAIMIRSGKKLVIILKKRGQVR
jgi:carbamoyltransferase